MISDTHPSGDAAPSAESSDDEPTDRVCFCNVVDAPEIFAAIASGARTIEAIGDATLAGTGCGGCRPDLALFLEASRLES